MRHAIRFGRNTGFTTLELLMVIVVIGILAVIAMPRFFNAHDRTHVGAAQYDLTALRQALAIYAVDHDRYPSSIASYEEFKLSMVDADGQPLMSLPSGETFRWVSYVLTRDGNYLLVIRALDNEGTLIKATGDGIHISP